MDEKHYTDLLENIVGRGGVRPPESTVDSAIRGACLDPLVDVLDSKDSLPLRLIRLLPRGDGVG